jgi:signal transduction histidine kinase
MGATLTMQETSESRMALRFNNHVAETRAAIQERIVVHISLLRGVAGLFAAGVPVDSPAFHRYVERLNITENYPGVQGVGFAARLAPEDATVEVTGLRGPSRETFEVWPESDQPERYAIVLLEPQDERNLRAMGYDMFSEPVRREAMVRARDSGAAASSGAVTLVQEIDSQRQSGFLIYQPIYEDGGVPTSLEERRAQLVGFAYSPFRADDLFAGIFGAQGQSPVAFAIYDGMRSAPNALLHSSPHVGGPRYRPAFTASETIQVAGRPWTIVYSSQPAFDASGDAYVAPLAAITGVVLSLMLFAVAWAQARARYEAELAVRARDTFLSVASHELKTPLTSLYGNAQLLQRRAARSGQLPERERANVEVIVEQARRLSRLIDDLLDHSRLQEGRIELHLEPIDLRDLVRRVAADIRPTLTRHTLNVKLPAAPLAVLGDVTRLEQVLFNLITNAVKYSPAGGAVEVVAARADGFATVTVLDRGIGIPADAFPQLFSPFYRAPNAVSKQIGGMGIGLYVVKELVERHGGALAFESEEGVGSSFTFSLPLEETVVERSVGDGRGDTPVA